ncbi:MAG TPA: glycosyltransferase [Chloroflexaceae bacterium]|nr:glycosyltransferase [Chloroflexaceae bacterium]
MNITILAVGSRGDVQPGVALGAALRRAGHAVRLASYAQFEGLAREHGLEFGPIAGDIMAVLQSDEGRAMVESRHPGRLLRLIRDTMDESYAQARDDIVAACADADGLVSLGAIYYSADAAARLRGVPHVTALLQPLGATGEFHAPLLPAPPVRAPAVNRLSHQLSEQLFWTVMRPTMNRARRDFGLAPLPWRPTFSRDLRAGAPALYAFSRLLVPRPADWPPSAHVTGFWFLDAPAAYAPPPDLAAFLAAGDPPVYVGFGSMSTRSPRRTAELALRALELSGRRGLLMRGWGGMHAEELPPSVQMIDGAPHAWLFPRMGAVVHHGGSGTTGAGLLAGVPSILVPFFADQPFWAERVAALGVGPAPIPRRRLTAEGLARAIEAADSPAVRRRAAAVGQIVAAEDGVGRAVALVERAFGRAGGVAA